MKKSLLPFAVSRLLSLLGIVLLFGFIAASPAWAAPDEERVAFPESLGPVPPQARATMHALAATETASRSVHFSVSLQMRNYAHLQERIARGETVSAEEMETSYLPLPADYAAVKKWLEAEGFTVRHDDPSRLAVFVQGTLAQIEHSLQTTMVAVTIDGVDYPSASAAPSLPARIAAPVLGINGLQTYHHLHPHSIKRPQTVPDDGYMINDILKVYDASSLGVTGKGQTIAILIDTTPKTTDLTKFWTNNGVAQTTSNVTTINVNNETLPATSGEETLDVEWSGGIASGAKIRVYATGDLEDDSLDAGLSRIISDAGSDATIRQLSISLGEGETYESSSQMNTDAQYFATLASKGVSTFVSSGDGGSTPDDTGKGNEDTGPLQVEYYSSDPSVTGVGGTSLQVTSSDTRSSETAWSGSGGGVSIQFSRPSWQTGTGVPSGTTRCVPDVSMPADPNTGAYVYLDGSIQVIGGTSWSSPTWAGFCALINEARANAGKTGGIGLLNPSLYPLIGSGDFYDIVSGSNAEGSKAKGNYSATTGYDRVTGLGSPDVAKVLNVLVGQTSSAPTVTGFTPNSGPVGTSVTISGTNFSGVTGVKFNGTAASYTVGSSTSITATVPSGATTGAISVTTSAGTATTSSSFTVTNNTTPAPTVTGFTPTSGPTGTSVTISGTNLTGATTVLFNTTSATFTVVSAAQITATVPTGATTGAIKVTTPGGTAASSSSFTVTTTGGSTALVISQVYGGGGGGSATYANDYVELYNPTASSVSLSNYSVQYASSKGTSWQITKLTGSIAAGHYFLVGEEGGSTGASLPTPDAQGSIAMSATAGKIALVNGTTAITGSTSSTVVDFVGYGAANDYEGSGPAPTLTETKADLRGGGGKTNTHNNASDFASGAPNPRNSKTAGTGSAMPSVTSGDAITVAAGDLFTYQIEATNGPTGYGVGGLFGGVSVNKQTGLISGTPTGIGTHSLELRATNASGTGTGTLSVTVTQDVPQITSTADATATVGRPFSYQITATGNPNRFGVGGLFAGISVDQSTGLISGTPTSAGTHTLNLRAANSVGTGSLDITLTVGK